MAEALPILVRRNTRCASDAPEREKLTLSPTYRTNRSPAAGCICNSAIWPVIQSELSQAEKLGLLIPIITGLVGPINRHPYIIGLFLSELSQLHSNLSKVKPRDLLVQFLG